LIFLSHFFKKPFFILYNKKTKQCQHYHLPSP
jgi:hypothetical protein